MLTTSQKAALLANAKRNILKPKAELQTMNQSNNNNPQNDCFDRYCAIDENINYENIKQELESYRVSWNSNHSNLFWDDTKEDILKKIADQFMLGEVVATFDKNGGPVDTIHNVRKGIYSTESEMDKYQNRGDYNPNEFHKDNNYIKKNAECSALKKNGQLFDSYTDKKIHENESYDLDHTISTKEIHDDPGRVLAGLDGPTLANKSGNLHPTSPAINRRKKAKPMAEFIKSVEEKRANEPANNTANKLKDFDLDKSKAIDDQARKTYNSEVNKKYYTSENFQLNTIKESALKGGINALRSTIGIVMSKTIAILFDEVRIFFKHREYSQKNWLKLLEKRLKNVGEKIIHSLTKILDAALHSFIDGFFSSLITTIVNVFVSTLKKAVRLIREGFTSIYHAIKFFMNPPVGMSKEQKYHEFGKLILLGLGLSIGILIHQNIEVIPFVVAIKSIPVIGEAFSLVLSALLTGIIIAIAAWGWDKLDLFGVNSEKEHEFVMQQLVHKDENRKASLIEWLEEIRLENPERYQQLRSEAESLKII